MAKKPNKPNRRKAKANPSGIIEALVLNPIGARPMSSKRRKAPRRSKRNAPKSNPANPKRKRGRSRRRNPQNPQNPGRRNKRRRRNPDTNWGSVAKTGAYAALGVLGGAAVAAVGYAAMAGTSISPGIRGGAMVLGGLALAGFGPVEKTVAAGAGGIIAAVGFGDVLGAMFKDKPSGAERYLPRVDQGTPRLTPGDTTNAGPPKDVAVNKEPKEEAPVIKGLFSRGAALRGLKVQRVA